MANAKRLGLRAAIIDGEWIVIDTATQNEIDSCRTKEDFRVLLKERGIEAIELSALIAKVEDNPSGIEI
jgi:hypothetical protein